MFWGLLVVHWLHVFLAIAWFGSVMYRNLILFPTITHLAVAQQRTTGKQIHEQSQQIIIPVAFLVVGLGIIRGTIVGQIQSPDDLINSAYGVTWLIALLLGIAIFIWEVFGVNSALDRLYDDDDLWASATVLDLVARMRSVRALAWIEFGGFCLIFTCMILMRFGW